MNKKLLLQASALFALNAFLCFPLFTVEYLDGFQSNEGSWIAMARFFGSYWPHVRWYPWTDGGMPIEATYLPLVQTLTAIVAAITHASPALVFHFLSALAYALGPVALFVFVARLSGRTTAAFAAALLWSLFSPSVVLPSILKDAGTVFALKRLQNIVYWGETPHNVSLVLVPVALLLMMRYFKSPCARRFALVVLGFAAVMLTNAFGVVLIVVASVLLLVSQERPALRHAVALAGIFAVSYLLICRVLPPSLARLIAANSQVVAGDFRFTARSALLAAGGLTALILLWWATRRLGEPLLRFSILFLACFGGITILGAVGFSFLPQPYRYHLEMEIGICLVAGFLVEAAFLRLPRPALLIAAAICIVVAYLDYGYSRRLIHAADVPKSAPYRQARWIADHLPGQRAMVSGESSLWFNVFADNPQLSGGHEPSAPNWMQQVAVYTVYTGENAGARDAVISTFWLKAFGCGAITVPGPSSADHYHPFVNPAKFDGVLPLLWRENGDSIYQVPQRSTSLAHVIPSNAAVQRRPIHGLDLDPARAYVSALDDSQLPRVSMDWIHPDHGRIAADIAEGQILSVQVTYDDGWRAVRDGQPLRVTKDGLGLIVIEPGTPGHASIDLTFDGGAERTLCSWIGLATAIGLAVMLLIPTRTAKDR
jgi:hypothetical protein